MSSAVGLLQVLLAALRQGCLDVLHYQHGYTSLSTTDGYTRGICLVVFFDSDMLQTSVRISQHKAVQFSQVLSSHDRAELSYASGPAVKESALVVS